MPNSQFSYWHKQVPDKPLFGDIEWSKPEQRAQSGRLAILGGSSAGFAAVAEGYTQALKTGIGQCRVVLPDIIKKAVPPTIADVLFVPTNPSGGMAKEAELQIMAATEWSQATLLIGDSGNNSETAILYEKILNKTSGPLVIARDTFDLLRPQAEALASRRKTLLVLSFAQLQKLFQTVYYPKVLTFSMQLTSLVEVLHKFTITYPTGIMTFHNQQLVVAENGEVSTTPLENPMALWRGNLAVQASVYWTWNPQKLFQAVTASAVS